VEDIIHLGTNYKLRVRKTNGHLEEVIITDKELEEIQNNLGRDKILL